jgi:predicted dinucleotide-binding enzyme
MVRSQGPGTRLVRAFNAINAGPLANQAFEKPERLGIPLASDDAEALKIASQLVSDAGFDPVPVGGLARAREFDVGTRSTRHDGRRAAQGPESEIGPGAPPRNPGVIPA